MKVRRRFKKNHPSYGRDGPAAALLLLEILQVFLVVAPCIRSRRAPKPGRFILNRLLTVQRPERLPAKKPIAAFTLLEVMAAVLIAGLMLTSLYASEAGSIKVKQRAINMSLGALLVRCKMGEIEEQIAEEGLPAVFASESDTCCAEAELEGFRCDWEINRIVLPETMFMGEEEEQEELFPQGGTLPDTAVEDPTELLSGPGAGEIDALTAQAMQFVYPVLKPSIEEQIRRVTIVVRWKEGAAERSFSVNRYLVAEQPPPVPEE